RGEFRWAPEWIFRARGEFCPRSTRVGSGLGPDREDLEAREGRSCTCRSDAAAFRFTLGSGAASLPPRKMTPMIPRLRQVQFRNFRSIGRAVVDLEPSTVLVGANGSGKSNFLASLAFVKACLLGSPALATRYQGSARIAPRWEPSYSRTGFRFLLDLGGQTADYAFEIAWDQTGSPAVTHELCRVEAAGKEQGFEVAAGEFRREIPGIRAQIQPDRLGLVIASATEEFRPI